MILTARQQQIRHLLEQQTAATVGELAIHFKVSDETIRRDLKSLSADRIVEKFHGGVRLSSSPSEAPFNRRLNEAAAEKTRIAQCAAQAIPDNATLLLDNSTTCCFLAHELVHRERLTVLTISLEIARIFSTAKNRHRIILPGGELHVDSQTLTGLQALDFLARFTPDYFIFSVAAGSPRGCLDFDSFEAEFKRAMIPIAKKTMLLIDSSKFTKPGLIHVCDWSAIDTLVSDNIPQDIQQQLNQDEVLHAGH